MASIESWSCARTKMHKILYRPAYTTTDTSVKSGKSIQDHMCLIDTAMNDYSEIIKTIEDNRIGPREVEDTTLVEGNP